MCKSIINKSIINISDAVFSAHEITDFNTISLYFTLPPSYLSQFCISISGTPIAVKLRIEYARDAQIIPVFAVCEAAAIVKDCYGNIGFDMTDRLRWHFVSLTSDDIDALTDIARKEINGL